MDFSKLIDFAKIKSVMDGALGAEDAKKDIQKKARRLDAIALKRVEAPGANAEAMRIKKEKELAMRRTTGRASTVLTNGSNTLG